ncbi:MAG: hypothetical protein IBJ07_08915 [Rhizobiaceae bacterium]|nr:hypothetical protein [Rhizobiaceae bacterium]
MTGAEIMAVVGFFVMISGVLWGIWWRIEGKVKEARDESNIRADAAVNLAAMARSDLADYKLHAAETFATKAGMQEQTSQLLRAIESVGSRIDGLHERLDRVFERPPARRAG